MRLHMQWRACVCIYPTSSLDLTSHVTQPQALTSRHTGVLVVFKEEAVWMHASSLQVQHPLPPSPLLPCPPIPPPSPQIKTVNPLYQVLQSLQRDTSCPVVCRSLPWGEVLVGVCVCV